MTESVRDCHSHECPCGADVVHYDNPMFPCPVRRAKMYCYRCLAKWFNSRIGK